MVELYYQLGGDLVTYIGTNQLLYALKSSLTGSGLHDLVCFSAVFLTSFLSHLNLRPAFTQTSYQF